MAGEPLPWGDEFDTFLSDMDDQIRKDYGMSLRDFFLNPDKFSSMVDIDDKIKKIRAYVDEYFSNMMESMHDEVDRFNNALKEEDAKCSKIDEAVSTKAALARIPYVRLNNITPTSTGVEEIGIDDYNNSIDALIAKLINVSTYVSDMSTEYKNYKLGHWMFSGQKNYVLSINMDSSPVIVVENLQSQMNAAFDTATGRLNATKGK